MKGLLESLFHVVSELIRETERVPGGTRFCFGLQKKNPRRAARIFLWESGQVIFIWRGTCQWRGQFRR